MDLSHRANSELAFMCLVDIHPDAHTGTTWQSPTHDDTSSHSGLLDFVHRHGGTPEEATAPAIAFPYLLASFASPAQAISCAASLKSNTFRTAIFRCPQATSQEPDLRAAHRYGLQLAMMTYPGQIILSSAATALDDLPLPQGFRLRSLGPQRLPDLQSVLPIYQLEAGEGQDFPPLRSLSSLPNNLPWQLTPLIGRERDMVSVSHLVTKSRLVTLTGSGGCGKSRLACHTAASLACHYADGTWLVDLQEVTEPSSVPGVLLSTLRPGQGVGNSVSTADVIRALEAKSLLLILDPCEHLLPDCASLVDTLLRACPRISLLVVSREPLHIEGEAVMRVSALAVPANDDDLAADGAREYSAIRMFAERASAAQIDFELKGGNLSAVRQICARLDGVPLFLEMATAQLNALSVAQIADRLESSNLMLTRAHRTTAARHRSLNATLDWSFDLLSEKERILWTRLAIFEGPFSLRAAEFVGDGDPLEDWEILHLLARLVDKSLVAVEHHLDEAYYRLLETSKRYGRAKMNLYGQYDTVESRHVAWYQRLILREHGPGAAVSTDTWMDELHVEHDNVAAALSWCADRPSEHRRALDMASRLGPYWLSRGDVAAGGRVLANLLAGAQFPYAERIPALISAGRISRHLGDYERAVQLAEESNRLARDLRMSTGLSASTRELGMSAAGLGDFPRARAHLLESLSQSRTLAERQGVIRSLYGLSLISVMQGQLDEARALLSEGLNVDPGEEGHWRMAFVYSLLGVAESKVADIETASTLLQQAADRATRTYAAACATAATQGIMHLVQENHSLAASTFEELLRMSRASGLRSYAATALHFLAVVQCHWGKWGEADALHKKSLSIRNAVRDRWGLAHSLEGLALVAAMGQHLSRAVRLFAAADGVRQRIGARRWPSEQSMQTEQLASLRSRLGSAFDRTWSDAQGQDIRDVVNDALKNPRQTRDTPPAQRTCPRSTPQPSIVLTPRQLDIVRLVARGLSDKEVAANLDISPNTVDVHLRKIFARLGVGSRAGVAVWAVRQGVDGTDREISPSTSPHYSEQPV